MYCGGGAKSRKSVGCLREESSRGEQGALSLSAMLEALCGVPQSLEIGECSGVRVMVGFSVSDRIAVAKRDGTGSFSAREKYSVEV